ncbi:hypothetical protein [Flavobacterium hercynium]|uniref:Uncharacterized protein n=1 Tax=Flavobacterium hercynium TaxID=387094 RepID=A0A226HIH1_9FLAO|nr:hypothetical protein [Flavobacterium hercynium]OXA93466.1 hypothetical protein B0A66_06450 [Flavobacterium hercynium]SMP31825.1 hypothetical protein SAMN06265346_11476 [Flavobacterium hercynium]
MQVSYKHSVKIFCVLVVVCGLAQFFYPEEKKVAAESLVKETELAVKEDSTVVENEVFFDTTACSKKDVELFLSTFIKEFNTNKASKINRFVDKNDGLAIFAKDGVYPILSFSTVIDDWIEWFDFKISDAIFFEKFPEYIGDTEFAKTGFFYRDYKNKFSLDDFQDDYSNRSDEDKKPYRILEKTCNYRADAMSKDGSRVLTLYFRIYKDKKQLVAISQDTVDDVMFTEPEKEFIKIDTKTEVEAFLAENKRFCDIENKGYIDFDKKELTYCDFGDKPFSFTSYKIDSATALSKKIKIREIEFYDARKKENFTLRLSNKGTFTSYQMGARPIYVYSSCN